MHAVFCYARRVSGIGILGGRHLLLWTRPHTRSHSLQTPHIDVTEVNVKWMPGPLQIRTRRQASPARAGNLDSTLTLLVSAAQAALQVNLLQPRRKPPAEVLMPRFQKCSNSSGPAQRDSQKRTGKLTMILFPLFSELSCSCASFCPSCLRTFCLVTSRTLH